MTTSITSKAQKLMFKDSQPSADDLQKFKKQTISKEICNTIITEKLFKNLCDPGIKNLEFVNCTMTGKIANALAFSDTKEKVVFKKCIFSDLQKDHMIDIGIWKAGNETAIYSPDLMRLAEESSRLSEKFLAQLDAPEEMVSSQEMIPQKEEASSKEMAAQKEGIPSKKIALSKKISTEQAKQNVEKEIAYAKSLAAFVYQEILPKITDTLRNEEIDQIARQDLEGLRERILICIGAVDSIIERFNKHSDHIDLILNLITLENQTFTDIVYNGTAKGKHVKINTPRLIFDGNDLGPEVCITRVPATIYLWGREP